MQQQNSSSETLLSHCPFCHYCLTGLPEVHVCPECGRSVDRRWELFGADSYWGRLSRGWKWAIGLTMALWVFYVGLSVIHQGVPACWLLIPAPSWLGLRLRSPVFIAVGSDGVAVLDWKRDRYETYEWARISEADLDCFDRPLLMVGDQHITVGDWRGGYAAADRCVRCINAHLDEDR